MWNGSNNDLFQGRKRNMNNPENFMACLEVEIAKAKNTLKSCESSDELSYAEGYLDALQRCKMQYLERFGYVYR